MIGERAFAVVGFGQSACTTTMITIRLGRSAPRATIQSASSGRGNTGSPYRGTAPHTRCRAGSLAHVVTAGRGERADALPVLSETVRSICIAVRYIPGSARPSTAESG